MKRQAKPEELRATIADTVPKGIRWAWNVSNIIMLLQVSPFAMFLLPVGGWFTIAGALIGLLPILNLFIWAGITDRAVRRFMQGANVLAALPLLLGAYDALIYKPSMPVKGADFVDLELYASMLGLLGICVNLICLATLGNRHPFRPRQPITPDEAGNP